MSQLKFRSVLAAAFTRLDVLLSPFRPWHPQLSVHLMKGFCLLCLLIVVASRGALAGPGGADNAEAAPFAQIGKVEGGMIKGTPFSPDGKEFVTVRYELHPETVRVWDTESLKPLTKRLPQKMLMLAKFAPDSKSVITFDSKTIRYWDVATSTPGLSVDLPEADILKITMSADCERFTVIANNEPTSLWDATKRRQILAFHDYTNNPEFDRGSDKLATLGRGSGDAPQVYRVWDARTGAELLPPIESDVEAEARPGFAAFSPDGDRLALLRNKGFIVIDTKTGKTLAEGRIPKVPSLFHAEQPHRHMTQIGWSATGDWLYTITALDNASADLGGDPVQIWDPDSGTLMRSIPTETHSAVISPNGKWLLCIRERGAPELWDVAAGRKVQTFDGDLGTAAFSPDGRTLALDTGPDNTTSIWRLRPDGKGANPK